MGSNDSYGELIDTEQLGRIAGDSDCRIVDCRFDLMQPAIGREQYLAGHIPGASFADMNEDLADPITASSGRHPLPDAERFRRTLEGWGISNTTQVVAYDYANGALAARLWWMLHWMGHSRVAVLDGGLQAWVAAEGNLEAGVPDVAAGSFSGAANAELVVTTDEVAQAIASNKELNIVDARDALRFSGQTEPIDPVAGHVPGAGNFPLGQNLNKDGTWKSATELADAWRQFQEGRPDKPLVAMCGSGVTACHLVLSAQIAGLPMPRVYVGSWSEWIRDSERPIVSNAQ